MMKTNFEEAVIINSVAEYKAFYGLAPPNHPLITVFDLESDRLETPESSPEMLGPVVVNLYMIAIKCGLKGNRVYGRRSYDFGSGVLYLLAPGQISGVDETLDMSELTGKMLLIHPDFLAKFSLGKKIMSYGFFGYEADEALHLSDAERAQILGLLTSVQTEQEHAIDLYSQEVIISLIELILTYTNRFYNRQFITRKQVEHDLRTQFESVLQACFSESGSTDRDVKIPSVQEIADRLHVSPAYLGDMLRTLTGQTTQQHIHHALIERAKHLLLSTSLTVNETAYRLGFEYPQYFSRLFKSKTGMTPTNYRSARIARAPRSLDARS